MAEREPIIREWRNGVSGTPLHFTYRAESGAEIPITVDSTFLCLAPAGWFSADILEVGWSFVTGTPDEVAFACIDCMRRGEQGGTAEILSIV